MAGTQSRLFIQSESPGDVEYSRSPLGQNSGTLNDFRFLDTPGSVGINDLSSWLAADSTSQSVLANQPVLTQRVQTLTPVDFADQYYHVRVPYIDPHSGLARNATVDVSLYNNFDVPGDRADMREKEILVGLLRREVRRARGLGMIWVDLQHKTRIAKAFYGKGFPEDFALVFRYALRYGRTTPAGLNSYCDHTAKLGVDCSGFVNAYFMRTGRITREKNIRSYTRGTSRRSANDIQDLDVIVWRDRSHIAVIDHVIANTNPLQLKVVESAQSKHGLTISDYTILRERNDMFYVDRGEGGGSPAWVNIAEVS